MEIYEILDDVNEALSREDKMQVLANNDCLALRDIMKINFDPSVNIHISKNLPWQPNMEASKSLRDVTKYLVPLSTGKIERERADKSFVALLEAIHPMDAQILLEATKGQIKVKGLTQKLIQGVWGERIISK